MNSEVVPLPQSEAEKQTNISQIILEILKDPSTTPKEGIRQKDLIPIVQNKLGIVNKFETFSNTQSAVSKAAKRLITGKKILKNADNRYTLYDTEGARKLLAKDISKTVIFTKDTVFPITPSTLLLGVATQCEVQCLDLLKRYFGEGNYFDITFINGYVLVLLLEKDDTKLADILNDLNQIISNSINIHAKAKRIKLAKSRLHPQK